MIRTSDLETLEIRIYDRDAVDRPVLVHLPGLNGDWTLIGSFRNAIRSQVRFVEFCYPRTLDWSLPVYADAIAAALDKHHLDQFWVLGESFGSQVGWNLIDRHASRNGRAGNGNAFDIQGFILSGGFVRHPFPTEVRFARQLARRAPLPLFRMGLGAYARYARFRHRHAPETFAGVAEFISRRTELDRRAMVHRMNLILESDPRSIARHTTLPVYSLSGAVEPVVPFWPVRRWLRRNCPGYKAGTTVWHADHNVLGTAPKESARIVQSWIAAEKNIEPDNR